MTDLRHRVTAEETEQTIAELEMRLSTATGEKAEKIREYIAIERQVLQSIKDGAIITVVQRIPEKVITSDE